jgi:hypothetical protein
LVGTYPIVKILGLQKGEYTTRVRGLIMNKNNAHTDRGKDSGNRTWMIEDTGEIEKLLDSRLNHLELNIIKNRGNNCAEESQITKTSDSPCAEAAKTDATECEVKNSTRTWINEDSGEIEKVLGSRLNHLELNATKTSGSPCAEAAKTDATECKAKNSTSTWMIKDSGEIEKLLGSRLNHLELNVKKTEGSTRDSDCAEAVRADATECEVKSSSGTLNVVNLADVPDRLTTLEAAVRDLKETIQKNADELEKILGSTFGHLELNITKTAAELVRIAETKEKTETTYSKNKDVLTDFADRLTAIEVVVEKLVKSRYRSYSVR